MRQARSAPQLDWAAIEHPEALRRRCDQGVQALDRERQALVRRVAAGEASPLAGYGAITEGHEDRLLPLAFLGRVHPQDAMRQAARACELRQQAALQRLHQQTRLLEALRALAPTDPVE